MLALDTDPYVQMIRRTPRPTRSQMRAFAGFVAHDHSWYQRLPLRGAGEPFFLYLDVNPHAARVKREGDTYAARDVIGGPGRGYEAPTDADRPLAVAVYPSCCCRSPQLRPQQLPAASHLLLSAGRFRLPGHGV